MGESPSVQLGLDPQYPGLRLGEARPRRVGIHRRPPGLPVRPLLTRCPPSPCGRLSRPRTTTRAPPRPEPIGRRRAVLSTGLMTGGEGDPGRFPRSPRTVRRGRCPAIPLQPRHGYPAALRRGLRADGTYARHGVAQLIRASGHALLTGPDPPGLEPAGRLRGFHHWFLRSYTSPSRLPDPGRLAVPARSVVVGAAPARPGASQARLPPASPGCCDSPKE